MTTLRETLAKHLMRQAELVPDLDGLTAAGREKWLGRAAEVEAVVLAWVGARLAGARDEIRLAVHLLESRLPDPTVEEYAETALTTIRDALGVPVAPAGGEVAPEATGDEIGPQIGAEALVRHQDAVNALIGRARASMCGACPFLGCGECEAEATRRANGEGK